MEKKWRTKNIIFRCIVSTSGHPDKAYLGTAWKVQNEIF